MSDCVYVLEISQPTEWIAVCYFDEFFLDTAVELCRFYSMSEKTVARICENGNIVYESFYNRALDPDVDLDLDSVEDDFHISWQECGF